MNKKLLALYSKIFSVKNSRYVNRFVSAAPIFESGRATISNEAEQKAINNLNQGIENFKKMLDKYPFIKEINETIYIIVGDLDDLKFTVDVSSGKASVEIGWNLKKKPTLVLPLHSSNLEKLNEVTADGDLSLSDAYRFIRGLFIPFLKSLYQGDYSNLPKDKSYLKLDNFIHVEVINDLGIEVDGFPGLAQATVVNVDGQWLIFEGLQGDPDIKYSMDIKQALEFAYLIRLKIAQMAPSSDMTQLMPFVKKYNELKDKVTVYERKWHNVEELN